MNAGPALLQSGAAGRSPAAASGRVLDHLPHFLRFGQVGQLLRRLVGLPVWRREDFLADLPAETVARLGTIGHKVRGSRYPPAIFVHGVLPRSGTNFIANALALHDAVRAFPAGLLEFPLVEIAPGAEALRHEWLAHFPANAPLVADHELLAYLASGWLAALQADAPGRQLLLKSPHVRQIGLFRAILPRDKLVLCLRDGRDVIASTLATFEPGLLRKSFRQLVMEWRLASEAVLAFAPGGPLENRHTVVVRYEDMVERPKDEIRRILPVLGLDAGVFPFDRLARLPVYGSSTTREQGRQSWQPVRRSPSFKPIGRFENWPTHRKRLFEHLAGDTLRRAGYC